MAATCSASFTSSRSARQSAGGGGSSVYAILEDARTRRAGGFPPPIGEAATLPDASDKIPFGPFGEATTLPDASDEIPFGPFGEIATLPESDEIPLLENSEDARDCVDGCRWMPGCVGGGSGRSRAVHCRMPPASSSVRSTNQRQPPPPTCSAIAPRIADSATARGDAARCRPAPNNASHRRIESAEQAAATRRAVFPASRRAASLSSLSFLSSASPKPPNPGCGCGCCCACDAADAAPLVPGEWLIDGLAPTLAPNTFNTSRDVSPSDGSACAAAAAGRANPPAGAQAWQAAGSGSPGSLSRPAPPACKAFKACGSGM
mmetsp:Transcript_5321/g.12710  ORF Transcript_5321/g.12710 Transcript_5321/m.12710 type:complete len:319 (-) Transcript_5321:252-1208(-)